MRTDELDPRRPDLEDMQKAETKGKGSREEKNPLNQQEEKKGGKATN